MTLCIHLCYAPDSMKTVANDPYNADSNLALYSIKILVGMLITDDQADMKKF